MTPDEHTNQEFLFDVGDGHQLYVHDWGKKDAKTPIIYLHGGPGNGCDDGDKKDYDPKTQRVIFHDQRGSGKSLPSGSLKANTTPKLIEDIEKIATGLKLDKFILTGGSWGSTLALAYGIAHPERVTGMVLNGVFTATKSETAWLDRGHWRIFFPEVWQSYVESVPSPHRQDPSAYHIKKALGKDAETAKKSAYEYAKMVLALLKLDDAYTLGNYADYDPATIKTELHFTANQFFMPEGHILKHAGKLDMPIYLIAGRYDMVSPPQATYYLHKKLANGQIIWTINGHVRQHEARNIQRLLIEQSMHVR